MPLRDPVKQERDRRLRQRHAARLEQRLCTRCGRVPPEPGLKVCADCAEKRRTAEKVRRAKARSQGKLYRGRDPERCRRTDRVGDRRRRRAWKEAGLCTSCGLRRPEESRSVCEPCRKARRARDRRRYDARKAAGSCVRCNQPTVGGLSRCGRCLALEKERICPERKSAAGKRRYAVRRAQGACVDCGAGTAAVLRLGRGSNGGLCLRRPVCGLAGGGVWRPLRQWRAVMAPDVKHGPNHCVGSGH